MISEDLVYEYTKEIMQALKIRGPYLNMYLWVTKCRVDCCTRMEELQAQPGRSCKILKAGYNAVKEVSDGYSKYSASDDAGNYSSIMVSLIIVLNTMSNTIL